jgi:Tol biopolymer transport system component
MNGDGSGQVNLSNNSTAKNTSPSWSPDGNKIAFVRDGVKT